jgi:hypothetical protein
VVAVLGAGLPEGWGRQLGWPVIGQTGEAITAARRLLHQSGVITTPTPRPELANAARTTR